MASAFNNEEKKLIEKYFGVVLDDLTPEVFKKERKQLMAKYHPDKFQHFDDETVMEMATERYGNGNRTIPTNSVFDRKNRPIF